MFKAIEKQKFNIKRTEVKNQESHTLSSVATVWLESNELRLKGGTVNKYKNILSTHILPQLGEYPISQITSSFINSYLADKLKNGRLNGDGGLAPSYVNSIRIVITAIINYAVNEEIISPLKNVINKPCIIKKEPRIFTAAEQKCLEYELVNKTDHTKLGILISLYTGLRIGEVCALKWNDIDLENGIIHVRHTLTRINNNSPACKVTEKTSLVLDEPKTSSSKRDIPIPTILCPFIKRLATDKKEVYLISNSYKFLSPRTYEYRYHKILEKCRLRSINYHTLRHTFATRCIEAGVDVKTLSEILGHANVGITLNTYNNLVTSISKSFNFAEVYPNGNYNDMVLLVELTDRAGNSSYDYYVFGIDKTIPTIDVKYDNNTPDAQYTDFYKANRTATITITERNFRAKDVVFKITNTDKVIPGVDLTKDATWTKTPNENPDLTTYMAKIPYTADGDYTFNIAYKDNVQNTATPYADKFTLDKTIPTVDVAYDNNSAANGNYYKADRVATITINEHNFDAARVNVIGTATDNGTPIAFPVTSGWTSNGDVHTATIHYSADAKYSFDIEFNDKAGNSIADYTPVEFYVDKTLPVLSIADIVDKSANNTKENIGFTITATDTNFDGFAPVLTAVIKEADNSFTVKNITVGKMSDIENGARYVVTNLDTDGIYSITCTFVDKAGNAFNQVILEDAKGGTYIEKRSGSDTLLQFSVNRDGSTFMLNDFTSKLLKNYYVKKVGSDVKIIEINADKITANTVTLNGKKLTENTDYKVTHEFSTGGWHKYTYTIDKSLFEAEGEYNIVVSSKDAATNDAFSDVKGVSAKFVVDRTAPVITVTGMVADGIYKTDKQKVTIVPTDDGGALKSLIVRLVDEDGKVMKVLVDLEGDELIKALDENSGKIEFTIDKGMYQNVQIICDDYSVGEGDKENNVYNKTFENVTVDSNAFIVFWADKTLRWSVIGGTALLLAGIIALVIFLKKKKAK